MAGETRAGYATFDAMRDIYVESARKIYEETGKLDLDSMSRINALDLKINYDINLGETRE